MTKTEAINETKYYERDNKENDYAKNIFSKTENMAVILKNVVDEYKELSLSEIEKLIDVNSISYDECIFNMDDKGQGEDYRYQLQFKSELPDSKFLRIDFEIQDEANPKNLGYDIENRALYYACRGLSSQDINCGELEKVYTIWVCNKNIPSDKQHTVVKLSGESLMRDLMQGIIIYRGEKQKNDSGEYDELFNLLDGIFICKEGFTEG
jgi:hypothetical protein